MAALGLEPFRALAPWWNGDLQTLRASFRPAPPALPGVRLELAMSDESGDRLSALLHRPTEARRPDAPLVVLMHGLAGDENSSYMTNTARFLTAHGHPVLRLNLRGAGPSRPLCKLQYHAGRSEDLRDAVRALMPDWQARGLVLVGFSLAGNMTLKFAAEFADDLPVRAVASISAPIDLALTARNMVRFRNYPYNRSLLSNYKAQALGDGAVISAAERQAILKSRNFTDIDNWFVAPRNGFADAEDYWRKCMARQFLGSIALPALIIHAADDPLVPVAPYLDYPWQAHPNLYALVLGRGGHVGFHGAGGTWYAHALNAFLERLAGIH